MKFGFRKPSIKRSISAMTTGAIKRAIKRELIPGYGQRGMGWITQPKKAAYNRLYNITTIDPVDLFETPRSTSKVTSNSYEPKDDPVARHEALNVNQRGLNQVKIVQELISLLPIDKFIDTDIYKAINRLMTYTLGFCNKSMYDSIDYCEMAESRLNRIKMINPRVKGMALEIVGYIRNNKSAEEIYEIITHKQIPE